MHLVILAKNLRRKILHVLDPELYQRPLASKSNSTHKANEKKKEIFRTDLKKKIKF